MGIDGKKSQKLETGKREREHVRSDLYLEREGLREIREM
jgi:hypothetical protein